MAALLRLCVLDSGVTLLRTEASMASPIMIHLDVGGMTILLEVMSMASPLVSQKPTAGTRSPRCSSCRPSHHTLCCIPYASRRVGSLPCALVPLVGPVAVVLSTRCVAISMQHVVAVSTFVVDLVMGA